MQTTTSCGGGGLSFYAFEFLLNRAYVAHKYHKIFYDFYLRNQRGEKLVFIDGGVHNGVFADVALACGGVVHGFEPNLYLCTFLRTLYKNEPKFILHENAISTANEKTFFHNTIGDVVSQGGSIVEFAHEGGQEKDDGYEVLMINFAEFLSELIKKHKKIALIKLDIEGAEFGVLDAILDANLHENVEFIMVETHERYFENPQKIMDDLKAKIKAKNAKNIFLDWI